MLPQAPAPALPAHLKPLHLLLGDQVSMSTLQTLYDSAQGDIAEAVDLYFQQQPADAPATGNTLAQATLVTASPLPSVPSRSKPRNKRSGKYNIGSKSTASRDQPASPSQSTNHSNQPAVQSPADSLESGPTVATPTASRYYVGEFLCAGYAFSSRIPTIPNGGVLVLDRVYNAEIVRKTKKRRVDPAQTTLSMLNAPSSRGPTLAKVGSQALQEYTQQAKNTIVRLKTHQGSELGRLAQEVALFMAPLLDFQLAEFEGTLVYMPSASELQIGSQILVQVQAYLTAKAFTKTLNRTASAESTASSADGSVPNLADTLADNDDFIRLQELRQQHVKDALKRLFQQCHLGNGDLEPSRIINLDSSDDDGEVGQGEQTEPLASTEPPASTPGPQDSSNGNLPQLSDQTMCDIYAHAETCTDMLALPRHPDPSTLAYKLHDYQQQALTWLVEHESVAQSSEGLPSVEASSHSDDAAELCLMDPLWDRLTFPTGQQTLAKISGAPASRYFYFHRLTGELSLQFPRISNRYRGGILADEMGLGKTVEILGLIHATLPAPPTRDPTGPPPLKCETPSSLPQANATLIVCPMSLLAQWREEVSEGSQPGSLSVSIYYGEKRSLPDLTNPTMFFLDSAESQPSPRHQVIITSYGTLLADYLQYRAYASAPASTAPRAERQDTLPYPLFQHAFYRIVLDEAHVIKSRQSKTFKACSAVEAPRRWAVTGTPITNKLDDLASLFSFLRLEPWCRQLVWKATIGDPVQRDQAGKPSTSAISSGYGITTKTGLALLQSLLRQFLLRRTKSLTLASGRRIVDLPSLDIQLVEVELNASEKALYDAVLLDSRRKFRSWCAQGTIWHNYAHVFQLLTRLRLCSCHPQLLLTNLERSGLVDSQTYTQITKARNAKGNETRSGSPILIDDDDAKGGTPSELADSHAGAKTVIPTVELAPECPVCLEPMAPCQDSSPESEATQDLSEPYLSKSASDISPGAETHEPVLLPCHHTVCRQCWWDYHNQRVQSKRCRECPLCRFGPVQDSDVHIIIRVVSTTDGTGDCSLVLLPLHPVLHAPEGKAPLRMKVSLSSLATIDSLRLSPEFIASLDVTRSTKVATLLSALDALRGQTPDAKSVVFSQFTSLLALIANALTARGWRFQVLDGSMPRHKREQALYQFKTDSDCMVLLLSLRAGGTGLNLTCANQVFMMDPWWNTAIESQAVDRVHRLGQRQPVHVTKFIARGTVEERILSVQHTKHQLIGTALNDSNGPTLAKASLMVPTPNAAPKASRRQRLDELCLLFE
ncbi:DNA helicase rad5 [Dimargaris verticillata]|uniref:DNA helicase rad5 n=1 Tax=Dimargaris verticillata TaxID=2761393 RepID=A0A9W8B1M7_9FUNG|nr:DNA helicase rad5 [Dimargaris verticillata]